MNLGKDKEDIKKVKTDKSFHRYGIKLKIKDVEISPSNIKTLVIKEWIFSLLPIVEIMLTDMGILTDMFPLEDNSEITIEMARNLEQEPPILMSFLLHDYKIIPESGENNNINYIQITGIYKTTNLFYPIKTRSFSKKTSVAVLKEIAEECKFENIDSRISTADLMTWLQINESNYSFIIDILKKAYKQNDTIFTSVNRYGDFVITSLNEELNKGDTVEAIYNNQNKLFDKSVGIKKDGADENENKIYYNNFGINYIGGFINKTIGYAASYSYYDLEEMKKETIKDDKHSLTEYSFKDKNAVGKIVKNYTYNIFDSSNLHTNYYKALVQNKYLKRTFFSSYLTLSINATDKVNLFDKLNIEIPSIISESKDGTPAVNEIMSGEYLLGGLIHSIGYGNDYNLKAVCFRNGINASQNSKDEMLGNK